MSKKRVRRRDRGQWKKIIMDYDDQGMSIRAYCRKVGISDKSFYLWRKRFWRKTEPRLKDFIEVTAMPGGPKGSLHIKTPGGYCVEVPAGTNGGFLKEVITALASK